MFTGLIEAVGEVVQLKRTGAGARLAVRVAELPQAVSQGDSVCVSGACLTAVEIGSDRLGFDVSRETLERSTLGQLRTGARVNLERALAAGARLGGHFVQGHVDGIGKVLALQKRDGDTLLRVGLEENWLLFLVEKGSVTVDGVSLTIARLAEDAFSVALVPETLKRTTLSERGPGDAVNIETDVLGKYIVNYLDRTGPKGRPSKGLDWSDLGEAGFL